MAASMPLRVIKLKLRKLPEFLNDGFVFVSDKEKHICTYCISIYLELFSTFIYLFIFLKWLSDLQNEAEIGLVASVPCHARSGI